MYGSHLLPCRSGVLLMIRTYYKYPAQSCLSGVQVAAAEVKGRRELQEARSFAAAMEDRASALQEQARVNSVEHSVLDIIATVCVYALRA